MALSPIAYGYKVSAIVMFVVPAKTRSVPTSEVNVPPAAREAAVDMPGGKYIRLITVPDE